MPTSLHTWGARYPTISFTIGSSKGPPGYTSVTPPAPKLPITGERCQRFLWKRPPEPIHRSLVVVVTVTQEVLDGDVGEELAEAGDLLFLVDFVLDDHRRLVEDLRRREYGRARAH